MKLVNTLIIQDTIKEYVSYSQEDLIKITKDANELYQGFYNNFLVLGSISFAIIAIIFPLLINYYNRRSVRKLKRDVKKTKQDLEESKLEFESINNKLLDKESKLKTLITAHTMFNMSYAEANKSEVYSVVYYLEYLILLFKADIDIFNRTIEHSKTTIIFKFIKIKEFEKKQSVEYFQLVQCLKKFNDIKNNVNKDIQEHIDDINETIEKHIKLFEQSTGEKIENK